MYASNRSPSILTLSVQWSTSLLMYSVQWSPSLLMYSVQRSPSLWTFSVQWSPSLLMYSVQWSPSLWTLSVQWSPSLDDEWHLWSFLIYDITFRQPQVHVHMARNFNLVKYYSSKIYLIYLKQSRKTNLMMILARYEGCLELESIPVGFCWPQVQVYSPHCKLPCSQLQVNYMHKEGFCAEV